MNEKQLLEKVGISIEDWILTPIKVKELVVQQKEKIEQLEQLLKESKIKTDELQEKVNCNSENSHRPPSTDLNKAPVEKKKKRKKRTRGGQKGHKGHSRVLYPTSECSLVRDHIPQICSGCGEELSGLDRTPYRHQVVDIPPIELKIEEHRLHQLSCHHCGEKTRAQLPSDVEKSGYSATVVALVSVMSGVYRHSHRMIENAMSDFFGVKMSLGTVNRMRKEASAALSSMVDEAKCYIQSAENVCADETGFQQGNSDGKNPEKKKAWLWVAVTSLISFFQVTLSRSTESAMDLLGENFGGFLSSDRYASYNWVDINRRQLCWAHLKRDFLKISERSGVSRQIGRDLLAQEKKLFRLWRKVRDGTLERNIFQSKVRKIRCRLMEIISEGASYEIKAKEKTPLSKTVRTCRQLMKVEPALWLFVEVEGLEPTNNAAERKIRPAVLWKRTSFGSQSEEGSIFMARILTVVTSLRSQNRNVLKFMVEAIKASRQGSCPPSLLPIERSRSGAARSHFNSKDESTTLAA